MKKQITTLFFVLVSLLHASSEIDSDHVYPIQKAPLIVFENEIGKTIYVTISIAPDGSVLDAYASDLDPTDRLLANRVLHSIKQWKFNPPANHSEERTEVTLSIPIRIGQAI